MQRSCMNPEQREGNQPQGSVTVRPLVVAGGQAAVLFAPISQPLHAIAQSVDGPVEATTVTLGPQVRDGVANAPPPTVAPVALAGVALVAHDPLGTHAGATPACAPHRPLFEQRF